jgi:hypothetical protein
MNTMPIFTTMEDPYWEFVKSYPDPFYKYYRLILDKYIHRRRLNWVLQEMNEVRPSTYCVEISMLPSGFKYTKRRRFEIMTVKLPTYWAQYDARNRFIRY